MLLNLSNHPSAHWPENQINAAVVLFGEIKDLAFPQVEPVLDSLSLNLLVDEYVVRIANLNPDAVHIMGEMTFTYRLVRQLEKRHIRCIASTTERVAEVREGIKTSIFRFVQFRDYY